MARNQRLLSKSIPRNHEIYLWLEMSSFIRSDGRTCDQSKFALVIPSGHFIVGLMSTHAYTHDGISLPWDGHLHQDLTHHLYYSETPEPPLWSVLHGPASPIVRAVKTNSLKSNEERVLWRTEGKRKGWHPLLKSMIKMNKEDRQFLID